MMLCKVRRQDKTERGNSGIMTELPVNKIICGDCLTVMKDWPDKCVDLILTDPPYFLPAQHYQTRTRFKRNFSDLGILEHWIRDLVDILGRIVKPSGYIYMFCDGQSYPLFYYHLYQIVKSIRPLIWDKVVSINGYGWRHQHEFIIFSEMPEAKPIPTGDGDILKYNAVPVELRKHPAEKPINLLQYILQKHNGIVCDPMCGSGSVLVAAKQLSRDFIGIDISPEYCSITEMRLKAVETGVSVAEQKAGQKGLFEND